uniref:non-specific serine/threonine protein kinase n=1 Tax=Hyaloperonospora arabidopsidis (strain Emoy2) TaxID=559515 RepID=M4B2S6_HYAAE
MTSTFAFGLAKNGVNALPNVRRAATASSHISERLSSPNGPDQEESSIGVWSSGDDKVGSLKNSTLRGGGHLRKRGASVDKTNPFIGYFQTGTDEIDGGIDTEIADVKLVASPVPVPIRQVPGRTQSSATLSSLSSFYPLTLFTPRAKLTEWQCKRLLPFFMTQQDANQESIQQQQGEKKEEEKKEQKQQEQKKRAMFMQSLTLETPVLAGVSGATDERYGEKQQNGPLKRTELLLDTMSATQPQLAVKASSSIGGAMSLSDGDSRTLNSRFEQDFEVTGSLGAGGQGCVYKVRSKVDGCYYAIKKVVLPHATELDEKRAESQALREVRLMASMAPHSNVVRYHTAWTEVHAYASHITSSMGSDCGSNDSLRENDCDPRDLRCQQLELLDDETELHRSGMSTTDHSFSLEYSANSLSRDEHSIPGFAFEDECDDRDSVGLSIDEASFGQLGELQNEVKLAPAAVEPVTMKSQVVLYIQMELCGTAINSVAPSQTVADSHEPIHRILDQLDTPQQERPQYREETHSNLGAWLRSSLEERLLWSDVSEIHLEGLKFFLDAVQGAAHMHSYGVIHRDLKPDNIFIHGDVAKVGDFGLSKSVYADSTADGAVSPRESLQQSRLSDGDHTTALGTFTYASPEQLGYRLSSSNALKNAATRLKGARYSIKSDIFALGVILLELCCPFRTMMERSQVLTGVRHGVVPQTPRQHFPMEIDLVLRMTSIDPSERPTSGEVCEQLRRIIATSGAIITPASALEDLRELQLKLAAAIRQLRGRSKASVLLEALVSEMNDKVHNVGIALA